jgi:hypothetical protein
MSLYTIISDIRSAPPRSEAAAAAFLAPLTAVEQQQLIAAVYLGRDHIHSVELRSDVDRTRGATDHISKEDYARILYEKAESLDKYLGQLVACARASNFDLDTM